MSTIVAKALVTAPAEWPVPEERRTVSVLFADIVGSTALVDRLDPEEVRALQRAYFDTVAGVLGRWGGVVEKYVGDAVMALFGARESDGFDAYRAVRAGLEIQRALDGRALPGAAALRTRVGVATGEALVDVAALRDGAHGTASGAVITAAARLQEYAPPGAVIVCAATRRATAGLIDHGALPPLTVAGKPLPMDVALAAGVARREPAGHHGRLVGRRRQLACARDQVLRAVHERSPRWVSLVGPAGSGRSRVLHELRRAVDAVGTTPVPWYVAACPPYPERPLEPVADLLRAFAGVRAEDTPAIVRRRLLAALDGLVPPVRALSTVAALEGLLDGSFPAGAAVWQRLLLHRAATQPVVVAVDDLDRAAPAVTRFLRTLFSAAVTRGLPLAVVTTHRPEWAHTDPGPGDRRTEVPLPPLSGVETGRLLRRLLARAGRPTALTARLLPLVGGLPGHAEAYVRRFVDGAEPAAELPDRVRAAAGARLDTCAGPERAVTMVVATLGPAVSAARVDQALGWAPGRAEPVLLRLAGRGLLRRATMDGYHVADPALRRVAHDRLPRSVRADVARRTDLTTPTGAGGAVGTTRLYDMARPDDAAPAHSFGTPAIMGPASAAPTGPAVCARPALALAGTPGWPRPTAAAFAPPLGPRPTVDQAVAASAPTPSPRPAAVAYTAALNPTVWSRAVVSAAHEPARSPRLAITGSPAPPADAGAPGDLRPAGPDRPGAAGPTLARLVSLRENAPLARLVSLREGAPSPAVPGNPVDPDRNSVGIGAGSGTRTSPSRAAIGAPAASRRTTVGRIAVGATAAGSTTAAGATTAAGSTTAAGAMGPRRTDRPGTGNGLLAVAA
ncbi:AAA family ATPase [Micromonospora sp. RTGN7]|uniref:AAA family ATPase n=1 Tax=Micromonospora sp. RTGN7 TaxID=3016526 RepID=UPI0029FF4E56|nr:adenylate/guanylate cyclase domain-containing protein [Micromonospora sp. RTGN7]